MFIYILKRGVFIGPVFKVCGSALLYIGTRAGYLVLINSVYWYRRSSIRHTTSILVTEELFGIR